jgi:alpha-ketoglutaric semialdehyde dehydrogenase
MSVFRNFIDGDWVPAGEAAPNVNPSNLADVIGDYARGTRSDAEAAVAAAKLAFPVWASASPYERFEILDRIGSEIIARQQELGTLLAREEGKTVGEAVNEVSRAGALFKLFAGETLRSTGDRLTSTRGSVDVEIAREPLGVVALITPWNFPISIPAWKTAPALAYGNCVILKPADLTPGCAWALAEIISRSGLPKGAFNLVMGPGAEVGRALVESPDVAAVSFTGSSAVGKEIGRACFERGARVQLEMGGKNPLVVLDDADLDTAVSCAVQGAYFSTGQRCTASSRLIVTRGIHDQFVEALDKKLRNLRVGDALAPETEMGPVVSAEQLEIDLKYVGIGRQEGATLLCGGERLITPTPGYYLSPALFVDTHNNMRINREEVFGPVASVVAAQSYDEALAIANDTEYGLCAGVITRSSTSARHFKRHAQAGMITVNLSTAGMDFHAPFTGRKMASYGPPERGSFARDFYTAAKIVYAS